MPFTVVIFALRLTCQTTPWPPSSGLCRCFMRMDSSVSSVVGVLMAHRHQYSDYRVDGITTHFEFRIHVISLMMRVVVTDRMIFRIANIRQAN